LTQKDWYSPGEIRFKVQEALWLIQNLLILERGQWPPEASNYIDMVSRKTGRSRAPFETAAQFYAEITDRLEKCGIDGLILEAIESWGKSEESMAKYLKMPIWSIRKRAKSSLGYVASGPARRWHDTRRRAAESYEEFKKRRKKPKVRLSNKNLGALKPR